MKRRTIEGECAMTLSQLLDIRPGVTAVIGGGGKTTLLRTLGEELAGQHPVLLCTTTKILPFSDLPCARTAAELDELRRAHQLLCAGTDEPGTGKLTAPETPMAVLAEQFDYILVEADGAARRPLKAHAPHEPVIQLRPIRPSAWWGPPASAVPSLRPLTGRSGTRFLRGCRRRRRPRRRPRRGCFGPKICTRKFMSIRWRRCGIWQMPGPWRA